MTGFPEGHERIEALKFFVDRLLVAECLRASDPRAAANKLKDDAQAFADALLAASNSRPSDQAVVALEIGAETTLMAESVHRIVLSAL